jgi:uncharacterized membrane protein
MSSQEAIPDPAAAPPRPCSAAEIGAIAHLYRGEIYRSTVWRTRLDSTTNWAVLTTGIALSATFSTVQASPLPMALVGLIVTMFLLLEARRYRYFNIWRARAAVGPVPGQLMVFAGVVFHLGWMTFAYVTLRMDQRAWRIRQSLIAIG